MGRCSDKERFVKLFYDSRSISDLARKLEYKLKDGKMPGGVNQIINRYIDKYELDKSHLVGQGWAAGKTRESDPNIEKWAIKLELPWDKAFSFGSTVNNQRLLKRLVRADKKKYECEKCKIYEWMNDSLVLEIHHINGIHHDNREDNLQILCPNCHSQMERSNEKRRRIKNKKQKEQRLRLNASFVSKYKPVRKCSDCMNVIGRRAKTGRCVKCSQKHQRKVERPTKEALKHMIKTKPWTTIGKEFGVSDNAVRKWARSYGIIDWIKNDIRGNSTRKM